MTSYERIMYTLQGQKADRVPSILHCFMPAAAEAGFTMEEYRRDPKNMARAHIDFARKYGLDGLLIDVDTCMEAGAVGVPIDLPINAPARVTGPASTNINELMELLSPEKLYQYDRIKIQLEAIHLMRKEVGGELLIRGNCDQMAFSLAMLSYGISNFLADLLDEEKEEAILQLIDRAYEVHLKFHQMMIEAGSDMTSFGDSSCGPDMISRDLFLKFSLPFHKKLKKALQEKNILTSCHICGNLDLIIQDVADIGYAGVDIDYKTNMQRAAEIMRGKSVVFGPINPSSVFYLGTPDTMRREVLRILDFFAGQGIILCSGCAIPAGTPEANLYAFTETAMSYFMG
jgi:uroporphyrinogen decarboxylase